MSTPSTTIDDQDIRCPDLELSDEAIDALARLLVATALEENTEVREAST